MFYVYILLGIITGIFAGLLGSGGGFLVVPSLILLFTLQHMPHPYVMHVAIGTSLAAMIATSSVSVFMHYRKGHVQWSVIKSIIPGTVIGTVVGAVITHMLPGSILHIVFGAFMLVGAVQMFFRFHGNGGPHIPGKWSLMCFGFCSAMVSAILGISGSVFNVPFFCWIGIATRYAVGNSAACGFPVAVIGTILFMILGDHHAGLPWSVGYIYMPAFLGITLGSVTFAPIGVKLVNWFSPTTVERIFACLLVIIGINMLVFH